MVPSCTRSFLSTKKGRIPVKIIAQRINIVRWGKREIDLKNVEKKKIYAVPEDKAHAACICKTRSWQPSIDICNSRVSDDTNKKGNSWLIND